MSGCAIICDVLRFVLTSILSALLCFSPAMAATGMAAADDGVHVDPDSAPAVEYALPLQAARNQAGGSGSSAKPDPAAARAAASNPPAFGDGITPAARTSERPSRSGGSRQQPDGAPSARTGSGSAPSLPLPAVSSVDSDGGTPILFSVAGALLVLLVGGLVALSLRRRHQTA